MAVGTEVADRDPMSGQVPATFGIHSWNLPRPADNYYPCTGLGTITEFLYCVNYYPVKQTL